MIYHKNVSRKSRTRSMINKIVRVKNGVAIAERNTKQSFVTILYLHSGHSPDWIAKSRD